MGNPSTPLSVQKLQTALHAKARENPSFRFYALYEKMYRADVLQYAYSLAGVNRGAPGVDGVRFEDIEAYGLKRWIAELAQELRKDTCEPEAYIPKPNGKLRPLGIPTATAPHLDSTKRICSPTGPQGMVNTGATSRLLVSKIRCSTSKFQDFVWFYNNSATSGRDSLSPESRRYV